MTLTLSFPPDMEARLRERAAAAGKDVESLVREAIEEKLISQGDRAGNLVAPTMSDLASVVRSFSRRDDGWADGIEEAVRLGNQPPTIEGLDVVQR